MANPNALLGPEETRLVGQWVSMRGVVQSDEVTRRIESLVRDRLVRVGVSADGWDTLYREPSDDRLREHIYPQSERHGGGTPSLAVIAVQDAAEKYGAVVPSNTSPERTRER